jgi:hypothetical protein
MDPPQRLQPPTALSTNSTAKEKIIAATMKMIGKSEEIWNVSFLLVFSEVDTCLQSHFLSSHNPHNRSHPHFVVVQKVTKKQI